jgi:hypothetical protein
VNQQGALTYRGDSYTARLNVHAYEMATISQITPYDRCRRSPSMVSCRTTRVA